MKCDNCKGMFRLAEDFRDHLPCVTEVQALRADNERLRLKERELFDGLGRAVGLLAEAGWLHAACVGHDQCTHLASDGYNRCNKTLAALADTTGGQG